MSGGAFLDDYRPATFAERGVAIPFTTPMLASARVRHGYRNKSEFVLANPSGGPGYYVMGWDGVLGLTRVTVHDRLLHESVSQVPAITPMAVRSAARTVAAAGSAGRPAAKAAREQDKRDQNDRLLANFLLTIKLLQQAGLGEVDWRAFNPSDRTLRVHARSMLTRLEPVFGASAETIFGWIDELSAIIAPVGFPTGDYASRTQSVLAGLGRLRETIGAYGSLEPTEAGRVALFVADQAGATADLAARTLAICHAETAELTRLLRDWSRRRARVLEVFGRPDWLLDGWPTIAALWEVASVAGRDAQRAAIQEIERRVPVMPREVTDWAAQTSVLEKALSDKAWGQRRWVRANVDWRSGTHLIDRTARNEALKAAE